jgi:hypothetical protein
MLEHYLSHKQHFEFEIILHDNHNTDCFKIQILFFMNFKSGQQDYFTRRMSIGLSGL